MATWLVTLHFGPYWTRQAVGEAWSNQSAGHVKPSFGGLQKTFVGLQSRKQLLQGQSCWRKSYVSPFISRCVINCSPDLPRQMGFPLDIFLYRVLWWVGSTVRELSKNPCGYKTKPKPKRKNPKTKASACKVWSLSKSDPFPQIYRAGVNGGYSNHQVVALHYWKNP